MKLPEVKLGSPARSILIAVALVATVIFVVTLGLAILFSSMFSGEHWNKEKLEQDFERKKAEGDLPPSAKMIFYSVHKGRDSSRMLLFSIGLEDLDKVYGESSVSILGFPRPVYTSISDPRFQGTCDQRYIKHLLSPEPVKAIISPNPVEAPILDFLRRNNLIHGGYHLDQDDCSCRVFFELIDVERLEVFLIDVNC